MERQFTFIVSKFYFIIIATEKTENLKLLLKAYRICNRNVLKIIIKSCSHSQKKSWSISESNVQNHLDRLSVVMKE